MFKIEKLRINYLLSVMWIQIRSMRIMGGWLDPDPYVKLRIRIQDI